MANRPVSDICPFHPHQCQPPIYEQLDDLNSGEGFVLINDHDPKTSFY